MSPLLFGVLPAYGAMLVLAILFGIAVGELSARRAGVGLRDAILVVVVPIVPALVGAKLYGLIERGGAYGTLSTELFAGFRYPGGVVGWMLAVLVAHRLGLLPVAPGRLADIVAPSFGFSLAVLRIGCLLTGCCSGRVSDLPWAIRFPRDSQVWQAHVHAGLISGDAMASAWVHPLQIYFGVLAFFLGFACVWLRQCKAYDGQMFLAFATLYGLGQFFLEFLRFGPLPHVQYLSLAIALVAGGVLAFKAMRRVPSGRGPQGEGLASASA